MNDFSMNFVCDNWYICVYVPEFSAQAYLAYNPPKKGRPFVIATQNINSYKSTVKSLSFEAKELGLCRGELIANVKKRYKNVEIVLYNSKYDERLCEDIYYILNEFSPDIEVSAEKESAFINLSGMKRLLKKEFFNLPEKIIKTLRDGLSIKYCSCGMALSPYIAFMASRIAKINNTLICDLCNQNKIILKFNIDAFPEISLRVKKKLAEYNIKTVGDIIKLSQDFFKKRFGEEGVRLYLMCNGIFFKHKSSFDEKFIKVFRVFNKDENNDEIIKSYIREIADQIAFNLKTNNLSASKLNFIIKYSDNKISYKGIAFYPCTCDFLTLYKKCCIAFENAYNRRVCIRSIMVMVKTSKQNDVQLNLFDNKEQLRQENISKSITEIRKRMGFDVIKNAATMFLKSSLID